MKRYNPFSALTRFEWILWSSSMVVVVLCFFLGSAMGWLSLVASLIGVTALIFTARGEVIGQILIVVFAVLYGIISWQELIWAGYAFMKGSHGYSGLIWPLFFTGV